jgi:hypothetical protein
MDTPTHHAAVSRGFLRTILYEMVPPRSIAIPIMINAMIDIVCLPVFEMRGVPPLCFKYSVILNQNTNPNKVIWEKFLIDFSHDVKLPR